MRQLPPLPALTVGCARSDVVTGVWSSSPRGEAGQTAGISCPGRQSCGSRWRPSSRSWSRGSTGSASSSLLFSHQDRFACVVFNSHSPYKGQLSGAGGAEPGQHLQPDLPGPASGGDCLAEPQESGGWALLEFNKSSNPYSSALHVVLLPDVLGHLCCCLQLLPHSDGPQQPYDSAG